jgi:uncharacterized protein YgfB (UPF0149 family)
MLAIWLGCNEGFFDEAAFNSLDDIIPASMSPIIAHWIQQIQDACSARYCRSNKMWQLLLADAAITGRQFEIERCEALSGYVNKALKGTGVYHRITGPSNLRKAIRAMRVNGTLTVTPPVDTLKELIGLGL